jgi:hypothetical protein
MKSTEFLINQECLAAGSRSHHVIPNCGSGFQPRFLNDYAGYDKNSTASRTLSLDDWKSFSIQN